MEDSLHKRGKSLEDAFFRELDDQLLKNLQKDLEQHEGMDALSAVTGINDEKVLEQLAQQKISPETLVAVALIPLVAVAWADGKIQAEEREAIMNAAHDNGIEDGSATAALLESWLKSDLAPALTDAWVGYIGAMHKTVDQTAFNQMKKSVLDRVQKVAASTGGFLGMNAISDSEKKVIATLEKAFG